MNADTVFGAILQAFSAGLEIGRAEPRKVTTEIQRGISLALDLGCLFPELGVRTVLDVGANVGQSAHKFHRDFPHALIYCFEPVAETYEHLVENTRDHVRIKTFKLAVGATNGVAQIHVGTESSLASFVVAQPGSTVQHVPVTSVDVFCTEQNIPKVDLLKIDAEGWDLQVLTGAQRLLQEHRVLFLQVETTLYSTGDARFVELSRFIDALAPYRYELLAIYDQKPHLTGRVSLAYCNAVFVTSELIGLGA